METVEVVRKYNEACGDLLAAHEKLRSQIRGLPQELGFKDVEELIQVLRAVDKRGILPISWLQDLLSGKRPVPGPKKPSRRHTTASIRKRRVVVTAALASTVEKRLKDGKTVAEVEKELGVSASSINKIKKKAGLVKPLQAKAQGSAS